MIYYIQRTHFSLELSMAVCYAKFTDSPLLLKYFFLLRILCVRYLQNTHISSQLPYKSMEFVAWESLLIREP